MTEPTLKLHPYQELAKQFIIDHPYCGLFLDLGLGKTGTTLSALYDINPPGHVLVIAPKNIARSTWIDEIEKWNFPFRIKSLITNERGKQLSKDARIELIKQTVNEPATMYFVNRELVCDLVKHMPIVNRQPWWPFPNVIIDEAQSFKSYNSQRFKALKSVRPQIHRLIELTGTPTPNGLMDLWSEIYLLDEGQRLGRNITTYRETFFRPGRVMNGYPIEWFPLPGAENEIHRRIGDLTMSLKNTMLQLPLCTFNDINVYMDEKEKKLYRKMKDTNVLTLGDDVVTAVNAAVLTAKLSQMASGALYIDDEHHFKVIHRHKLEQTAYIIRNTGSPVLVAYHFKSDLEMLMTYLDAAGFEPRKFDGSPTMVHDWNDGKIPVMLIQPASAGHGLNLQQGGHTLIWYTIPWSLEEYQQCNARVYRQGQTQPVVIHHLMTDGTIDKRILAALARKDVSQRALLEAVRLTLED